MKNTSKRSTGIRSLRMVAFCGFLTMLAFSAYAPVQSQTRMDPEIRAELSSDSTVTCTLVQVVISFGGQQDTLDLQPQTVDSLDWDTTVVDLDSAGVYGVKHLFFWSDGQVTSSEKRVTTLGSASVSLADKQQIATLVADTLQARGFPSSGTGDTRCSVFVRDTTNANNVANVDVYVYTAANAFQTWNQTNTDGYVIFNLDSTFTYALRATKTGYVLPAADSFTVSGVFVDTVKGYLFSPGPAPNAYQHNVWGWFFGITGAGKSGILVEAKLNRNAAVITSSGVFISSAAYTDTTDTAGYWTLTLVNNDSISPANTYYKFSATDSGQVLGGVSRSITKDTLLDWTR